MPTSIRLSPEVEARLDRLAASIGRTKSHLLRELIENNLDRLEWEYQLMWKASDTRAGDCSDVRRELTQDG